MHLFQLGTEGRQNEPGTMTTWLVAADTLFHAVLLVPEGNTVRAAWVEFGADSGPERLLGSIEPTSELRAHPDQEEEALGSASWQRTATAQRRPDGWLPLRGG